MWGGGNVQGGGWLRTFLAIALCIVLLIFYSTPLSLVVDVVKEEKEKEVRKEEMGVQMAFCPCKRILPKVNLEEVALNATTCGEDAWRRGRHQKVLAFTFFEATGDQMSEEKENRQYLQVRLNGANKNCSCFLNGWLIKCTR